MKQNIAGRRLILQMFYKLSRTPQVYPFGGELTLESLSGANPYLFRAKSMI
jgi:hypothetical protein